MTENKEPTRVVPYLSLAGRAREAIEVWGRAFAAEQVAAYEENGHLRHAEVRINGGPVFLTDFNMEEMTAFQPTASISLHLEVPDGSLNLHLKTLAETGYIRSRKAIVGLRPKTTYTMTPAGRKALATYVESMRAVINSLE